MTKSHFTKSHQEVSSNPRLKAHMNQDMQVTNNHSKLHTPGMLLHNNMTKCLNISSHNKLVLLILMEDRPINHKPKPNLTLDTQLQLLTPTKD